MKIGGSCVYRRVSSRTAELSSIQLMRGLTLEIQPTRNEQDYDQSLAAIEELWGTEEGTKVGDKLDVLLVLVGDYEDKHHRLTPWCVFWQM